MNYAEVIGIAAYSIS